jgi:atypical dual specificity phosphatase
MSFQTECSKPHIVFNGEKAPTLIVLTGLPGSGKSTFSKHVTEILGSNAVRVSQDEMGRKGVDVAVADAVVSASKNKDMVIIVDRCNVTQADRMEWLTRLKQGQKAWLIWFATPTEECIYRAEHRKHHETLKGPRSGAVIGSLAKKFEIPNASAEGFSQLIRLDDESQINHLLSTWNMPEIVVDAQDSFFKFPRTRHILNLGCASRDDLIMTKQELAASCLNCDVWVEEKIDGANLGITIDPATMQFMVQNRSHYVNSKYHKQFEKLDVWLSQHSNDLFDVLVPGRHTLFGEWVYLCHSINYTQLPGYFVAFDLYDREEKCFWARERLEAALSATSIPLIAVVTRGKFKTVEDLAALVRSTSQYYSGPIEGLYIKRTDGQRVVFRGKIVRHDFLSGNDFWTKGGYTKNTTIGYGL